MKITSAIRDELRKSVRIMKRISKDFGHCKSYGTQCISCEVKELTDHFDSFVNFWLDTEEDKKKRATKKK